MDLATLFFLIPTLTLTLGTQAFSPSTLGPSSEEGPLVQLTPRAHGSRQRRCSCENPKDKECVYFCHIGIVWVNTPGQVVPYGVGSVPVVRLRRRAVSRCVCGRAGDSPCQHFCSAGPSHREVEMTLIEKKIASKFKNRYDTELWDGLNHRMMLQRQRDLMKREEEALKYRPPF